MPIAIALPCLIWNLFKKNQAKRCKATASERENLRAS